jgi:hypothetical protein
MSWSSIFLADASLPMDAWFVAPAEFWRNKDSLSPLRRLMVRVADKTARYERQTVHRIETPERKYPYGLDQLQ